MHDLPHVTFDATQALVVVVIGALCIGALLGFANLAARRVGERTRRAVAAAAKQCDHPDVEAT